MGRLTKEQLKELHEHDVITVVGGLEILTHKKCVDCDKVKEIRRFRKIKHRGLLLRCRVCERALDHQRHLLRKAARRAA